MARGVVDLREDDLVGVLGVLEEKT